MTKIMENILTDIDKAWEILMASKTNVRVVAQVSPAVRVAIGEEFGLQKGEDALGKLTTALRVLGVDLVVDGAIAEDAAVYQLACEVQARKEKGLLPVIYSRKDAWTEKALANPDLAKYIVSPRPAIQALSVQLKKMFLGDEKRTYVIAIVPCNGKKNSIAKGLRVGDLPATDLALTTAEMVDILRSADLDLKYLPASEWDTPFGVASGCGYIADTGSGFAEGVLRSLSADQSAEGVRRSEYSGVRGSQAVRVGYGDEKVVVAVGDDAADQVAAEVLAGTADYAYVEVMGGVFGCVGACAQPEADDNTKRLRAYGLYCLDKRSDARVPAASADTVALAAAFAEDCGNDGFEEKEVSLSPFDEEVVASEEVNEPAEEVAIEEVVAEEVVAEDVAIEEVVAEEVVAEEADVPADAIAPVEETVEIVEETVEIVEETVESTEEAVEAVEETAEVVEGVEAVAEVVEEVAETEELVEELAEEPVETVEEVMEAEVAVAEEIVEEAPAEETPVEDAAEETTEEALVEEAPAEEVAVADLEEADETDSDEEVDEMVDENGKKYHPNYRRMSKTERRKMKRATNKK